VGRFRLCAGLPHRNYVSRNRADQYIFNSAFQWKILFMATAGVNMATFYFAVFRRREAELPAKLIAALSLFLWIGVIVFGRMLTLFRPADCGSSLIHLDLHPSALEELRNRHASACGPALFLSSCTPTVGPPILAAL
jgi:hypothetical protein